MRTWLSKESNLPYRALGGYRMKGVLKLFIALVALYSSPLFAMDGIPMGDAVFYPSIEALYMHTDNVYLVYKNDPTGRIAANSWTIRPSVGFEFPLREHYFRFNLTYQYRDYDEFDLSKKSGFFGDFTSRSKFHNESILVTSYHHVSGVQEMTQVDPGYEATWSDTPFKRDTASVNYDIPINKLNKVSIFGNYNRVNFDEEPGQEKPFYSYRQTTLGATWFYSVSPLSAYSFQFHYTESVPDGDWYHVYQEAGMRRKYQEEQILVGWDGGLLKFLGIGGYTKIGYKRMKFQENSQDDYSGLVLDAGLKFHFIEFAKFDVNLYRTAYQSAFNLNNYYSSTGLQAQFHNQITRYFFWTLGYMYQINDYNVPIEVDLNNDNVPDYPNLPASVDGDKRSDVIRRAYVELGLHFTSQLSFRLNYQNENRDSSILYYDTKGLLQRPFSYTENRLTIQALWGW